MINYKTSTDYNQDEVYNYCIAFGIREVLDLHPSQIPDKLRVYWEQELQFTQEATISYKELDALPMDPLNDQQVSPPHYYGLLFKHGIGKSPEPKWEPTVLWNGYYPIEFKLTQKVV